MIESVLPSVLLRHASSNKHNKFDMRTTDNKNKLCSVKQGGREGLALGISAPHEYKQQSRIVQLLSLKRSKRGLDDAQGSETAPASYRRLTVVLQGGIRGL